MEDTKREINKFFFLKNGGIDCFVLFKLKGRRGPPLLRDHVQPGVEGKQVGLLLLRQGQLQLGGGAEEKKQDIKEI